MTLKHEEAGLLPTYNNNVSTAVRNKINITAMLLKAKLPTSCFLKGPTPTKMAFTEVTNAQGSPPHTTT